MLYKKNIDDLTLIESIFTLSLLLFKIHKKKVYVIIDEYDKYINESFGDARLQLNVLLIIKSIFESSFKTKLTYVNPYEKILITGITKIAKANIFSGLNNFSDHDILSSKYAGYFGIT